MCSKHPTDRIRFSNETTTLDGAPEVIGLVLRASLAPSDLPAPGHPAVPAV